MREDRSWFAVDSKSFEISMDVFGEKLKGIIVEISKGFTSWIRFGRLSLCCLLEGVKAYCRVSLLRGLLKVGRMEVGSLNWNIVQMRQADSYCALWLTWKQRSVV